MQLQAYHYYYHMGGKGISSHGDIYIITTTIHFLRLIEPTHMFVSINHFIASIISAISTTFFLFFYAQHFLLQCCIRLLTTLQKQLTLLNSQKHENFHKIMLYTRYIPFFFVCVNTRYIPYHL